MSLGAALDLSGVRVVVTGGSRGIGAATARAFAAAGAAVAVHFRRASDEAAAVLAALPAPVRPAGDGHFLVAADLSGEAGVESLFAAVAERWGGLDVLVNNAGVWVEEALSELTAGQLRETLALNVAAPFLCARAALPLFERSAAPSIVNLSSTAGQRGEAFYSAYAASKGALIAATKSWAVELAPRVRVNAVAPGWVTTDMTAEALAGEAGARALAGIPLGRIATPDDVAGPILFLASPLARHVTGEILNVNGGSVLCG